MKKAFLLFLLRLLPETRCFSIKRILLRLAGYEVEHGVRVCSSARFLGAGHIILGEGTWVGHESMLVSTSLISIGAQVDIAPRVYIGTGTHLIDSVSARTAGQGISKEVVIEDGAWIGAGSLLLPGTRIGRKSVIAAGAVVTGDIDSLCIAAGIPAKSIKTIS